MRAQKVRYFEDRFLLPIFGGQKGKPPFVEPLEVQSPPVEASVAKQSPKPPAPERANDEAEADEEKISFKDFKSRKTDHEQLLRTIKTVKEKASNADVAATKTALDRGRNG